MKKKSLLSIAPIVIAMLLSACGTATAVSGPQGPKGEQGIPGETGPQGSQGPKGDQGDIGPAGPEGSQGPQGETGPQGPAGENGNDGVSIVSIEKTSTDGFVDTYTITYSNGSTSTFTVTNGQNGEQGIQGNPGADGHTPNISISEDGYWVIDNVKTSILAAGQQGPQGETGPQGPQGEQGVPGQDGTSMITGHGEPSSNLGKIGDSYIDLDTWNFYVKNDEGWLLSGNIKGPQGPQGEQGESGVVHGEDGISIVSIEKTATNGLIDTYTITYSDGTTSYFFVTNGQDGQNGEQGIQGIQGVPGQDGHTPVITIGANGNWYVDGVDTEIKAQGPQGPQGEQGEQGETGPQGPVGPQGPQGEQGEQGEQGPAGQDGVSVISIIKTSSDGLVDTYTITYSNGTTSTFTVTNGQDGQDGATGATGAQGPQGEQGIQGNPGVDGHTPVITIGANGNWFVDGVDTEIKAQGPQGETGATGAQGPQGEQGETGPQGPQGPQGEQGEQGPAGQDGVSVVSIIKTSTDGLVDTYTITYSNGTTSTFTVTNGADGQDGQDGQTGATGAQGPQGEQGIQGIQGEPGADGHTPVITIGANGNWFVDGVDTEIKAQGPQGETGATGAQGPQGEQGEQGPQGEIGPQGPQGPVGQDGANGLSLLTGNGVPSSSLGVNGDSYIDLDNWNYYVKENNAWVLKGNIHGEDSDCLVRFFLDGQVIKTQTVASGSKVSRPTGAETTGYQVNYWYTMEDGYREAWNFSGCVVTSDVDLYADFIVLSNFSNITSFDEPVEIHTALQKTFLEYDGDYTTIPSSYYPDGQSNLSDSNPITISWDYNVPTGKAVTSYSLIFGQESDLSDGYEVAGTTDETITFYNPYLGKNYYKIVAYLNDSSTEETNIRSFDVDTTYPRNLTIEGMTNCRDLGGRTLPNGSKFKQGMIYRTSGKNQNGSLTSNTTKEMINHLGVINEINLAGDSDSYNLSLSGTTLLQSCKMDTSSSGGYSHFSRNAEAVKNFFNILGDENNYPVYFHCRIGTDRTGLCAILLSGLMGVPLNDIYQDYLFSNFGKIGDVRGIGDGSSHDIMKYMNDIFEMPGNTFQDKVYNTLLSIGVSEETLNAVIANLTDGPVQQNLGSVKVAARGDVLTGSGVSVTHDTSDRNHPDDYFVLNSTSKSVSYTFTTDSAYTGQVIAYLGNSDASTSKYIENAITLQIDGVNVTINSQTYYDARMGKCGSYNARTNYFPVILGNVNLSQGTHTVKIIGTSNTMDIGGIYIYNVTA